MNLKDLRKHYNLSQSEIAKIMDLDTSTVSKIEKGKIEMKLSSYGKLINALKISKEFSDGLIKQAIDYKRPKEIKRK